MKQQQHNKQRREAWLRAGGIALAVFVALNVLVAVLYRHRTYPRTSVLGVSIGNLTYTHAGTKLRGANALPAAVQLQHGTRTKSVRTADLGIYLDAAKLPAVAQQSRWWPPLLNLFVSHRLSAPVRVDQSTYASESATLAGFFQQDPTPAHITSVNGKFVVAQASAGYQLDTQALQTVLVNTITKGTNVAVPTKPVPPATTLKDPAKALQAVQSHLSTALTIHYNGKTAKPGAVDIASWYVQSGRDLALSNDAIRAYLLSLDSKTQNIDQAVANVSAAVVAVHAADINLFDKVKTVSYCVALRGVDVSNLSEFEKRIAATYADSRGWSLGGQVIFKQVSSGCGYTLWLASPSQMPSFGSICDSTWSCTVPPNIIINFDRWQNATTSWNAAHAGTLDEYRSMAINHESGHQFGFGHTGCPGPGQPAPVMEQQSIDLQGCVFNAWPTATEQNNLRAVFGL